MIRIIEFLKSAWAYLSKQQLSQMLPYILLGGLLYLYIGEKSSNKDKELLGVMQAVQDSTSHKIDNLGRKFSETSQIRSSNPKVFLNVKNNDEAVKSLQEEVKKLKGKLTDGSSVTQFSNSIHIDTTTTNGKFSDKWVDIDNSQASRTRVDVRNHYTVALIEDKDNYIVNVRNDNPYSRGVDSIKTYVKIPKDERKFSVGVGIGYNAKGEILPSFGITYKIFNLPF